MILLPLLLLISCTNRFFPCADVRAISRILSAAAETLVNIIAFVICQVVESPVITHRIQASTT